MKLLVVLRGLEQQAVVLLQLLMFLTVCFDGTDAWIINDKTPTNRLRRGRATTHLKSSYSSQLSESDVAAIRSVGGPRADVYGEMTAAGFATLATQLSLNNNDVFLDLGSGEGSLVIQAVKEFGVQHAMGIELSEERHDRAVLAAGDSSTTPPSPTAGRSRTTFVCGDAAGPDAAKMLQSSTVVWFSNLLFGDELQQRIAENIARNGNNVRAVVSLKPFPVSPGLDLEPHPLPLEMSWTTGKEQPGHPPMPGHPCSVYLRHSMSNKR